ncbi:MAG: ABATE domain-containing protein [Chloroflexota bacterium]
MATTPGADRSDTTGRHGEHSPGDGPERDLAFKLIGGRLCLDFANTVAWWPENESREPIDRYERFTSYPRMAAWSRHAGAITLQEEEALIRVAHDRPDEAALVLERARTLRQAIHWTFVAATEGRSSRPGDLALINEELQIATTHARIVAQPACYAWTWVDSDGSPDRVLWPVTRSAADLLVSPDLQRVHVCAGDPCGFLFLDTSSSGQRRWCIMQECGNRAKARRHYRRTHIGS